MIKILLVVLVLFSLNALASFDEDGGIMTYEEVLSEMYKIRKKIKVNDFVKKLDFTVTDHVNETITRVDRGSYSNESDSSGVFSSFSLPGGAFKRSRNSRESYTFYNTEMIYDAERGLKNQKKIQIKQDNLRSELKKYYHQNASDILRLKLLVIYGLERYASNDWTGNHWDVFELERLGNFIGFYGQLTLNHCVRSKYTGYENTSNYESRYSDSFSFGGLFNIRTKHTETRTHSDRSTYKSFVVTDCDITTEVFGENGDDSIIVYDLIALEKTIEKLKSSVYFYKVFQVDNSGHIFRLGNSYQTRNEGDNPFF